MGSTTNAKIKGFATEDNTSIEILTVTHEETENTYYCRKGASFVGITDHQIAQGTHLDDINDIDCMNISGSTIETLQQLENHSWDQEHYYREQRH